MAATLRIDASVRIVVSVTLGTVRASSLFRNNRVAAKDINSSGNWFKVDGIDAGVIAAEMVELETFRNRPDQQFI